MRDNRAPKVITQGPPGPPSRPERRNRPDVKPPVEFDVDIARALAHLRASDGELGRLIDRAGPSG